MARQSRGRLHFGRKQSPTSRSASAVAGAEAQEKRRKSRAKKWRERFRRIALSSYSSSRIVQNVCNLFRFSADYAGSARGQPAPNSSALDTVDDSCGSKGSRYVKC